MLGEDVLYSDEEGSIEDDFCDDTFVSASEPSSEAPDKSSNQSSITSSPSPSRQMSASNYEYVVHTEEPL